VIAFIDNASESGWGLWLVVRLAFFYGSAVMLTRDEMKARSRHLFYNR
jgi:hypothetical protein